MFDGDEGSRIDLVRVSSSTHVLYRSSYKVRDHGNDVIFQESAGASCLGQEKAPGEGSGAKINRRLIR